MKLFTKLAVIMENNGKRKTMKQLRLMTDRQLIDCGYSPDLLSEGIKAWPWRELPENFIPLKLNQNIQLDSLSTMNVYRDTAGKKRILAEKEAA